MFGVTTSDDYRPVAWMGRYPVDVTTLRFIAMSRNISVFMPQEPLETPFALWEDGRRELGKFLERAGAH